MFDNGFITREQLASAQVASLKLAPPSAEANGAPYFMDLVRDQLLANYSESDLNNGGMRVYTSLDPDLQKAAVQAVEAGLKQVDDVIRQGRTRKTAVRGKKGRVKPRSPRGPCRRSRLSSWIRTRERCWPFPVAVITGSASSTML